MKPILTFRIFTLLLALLVAVATVQAAPGPLTEYEKIEKLIEHIANLNGAVFIRNGNEYTTEQAAEHLRLKLRKAGGKVKTADQFVTILASKSSMSGEPYKVRMKDGRTLTSEQLLRQELARLNKIK